MKKSWLSGLMQVVNGDPSFMAYETRFWAPAVQSGSGTVLYYSYEVAAAHIIMLGSYAPYGRSSEQYAWLLRDLASIDRGRTPWVIVAMHAPWYNSNEQHYGEVRASEVFIAYLCRKSTCCASCLWHALRRVDAADCPCSARQAGRMHACAEDLSVAR